MGYKSRCGWTRWNLSWHRWHRKPLPRQIFGPLRPINRGDGGQVFDISEDRFHRFKAMKRGPIATISVSWTAPAQKVRRGRRRRRTDCDGHFHLDIDYPGVVCDAVRKTLAQFIPEKAARQL